MRLRRDVTEVGTDCIEACFLDSTQREICSNIAKKTWVECILFVGVRTQSTIYPHPDAGPEDLLLLRIKPNKTWPVLENDVPIFAVPDRPRYAGRHVYFQVLMHNPLVFPSDPVQMSNGLDVTLDSPTIPVPYGTHSGIQLCKPSPLSARRDISPISKTFGKT